MTKGQVQVRYIGVCGSKVDVPGFGIFETNVDVEVSPEVGQQLLKRGDFVETKHWTQEWEEMGPLKATTVMEVKEHG